MSAAACQAVRPERLNASVKHAQEAAESREQSMAAPVAATGVQQAGAAQGEHARQHHSVAGQPRPAKALAEQQEREQCDEHRHHARQHDADIGGRREGHAE